MDDMTIKSAGLSGIGDLAGAASTASRSRRTSSGPSALTGGRARRSSWMPSCWMRSSMGILFFEWRWLFRHPGEGRDPAPRRAA